MTKFKEPGQCGVLVLGKSSELFKNDKKTSDVRKIL